MAKSKLMVREHTLLEDDLMAEVWNDNEMIAAVYGADETGVRVISKYPLTARFKDDGKLHVIEVIVDAKG